MFCMYAVELIKKHYFFAFLEIKCYLCEKVR